MLVVAVADQRHRVLDKNYTAGGHATSGEVTTDQAHPFCTAGCEVTVHGAQ